MSRLIQKLLNLALAAGVLAPLAVILGPLALRAGVIFSNVSESTSTFSLGVRGSTAGGGTPKESAQLFVPGGDFSMTDAEVFINGGAVDIFLYSGNTEVPGTEIAELATDVSGPSSGFALETASGFAPVDLTAGTDYWLVLAPATADTNALWEQGGSSLSPAAQSSNGGAGWTSVGINGAQFEIDGTPIPEPSELPLLLGAAAACLLLATRRKRSKA